MWDLPGSGMKPVSPALESGFFFFFNTTEPPGNSGQFFFLIKLNVQLFYKSAIILIDIYPREVKTYVHTNTSTQVFTATLFVIAPKWKPPRYPPTR